MPLDTPFRLGPFVVDAHGRLQPGEPDLFPSIHVSWRGCAVHARLFGSDASGRPAHLALTAVVGRVPSSAGGDAALNQERRRLTFTALQAITSAAATGPRLRLLPDHRFVMEADRTVELPISAADLLTQLAAFLLDLGPYLDLLAEADVPVEAVGGTAPSRAGMAKT